MLGAGCNQHDTGQAGPVAVAAASAARGRPQGPRGIHRKRTADLAAMTSAPAGAHLNYFGGRVVSNIHVVEVIYGTGSYIPEVTSTTSPNIPSFYQGVTNSPFVDWLTEYDTDVQPAPTSDQVIGRGTFVSQVTITPSAANNGATIDDTNIQAELAAQITAGNLPAPTHDAGGNNNTYYAVFFPHGKVVTLQGSASCQVFCAYHSTVANVPGFGEIYYGVHPDMQAGSGCEGACGAAPTTFGDYTQVASHELVETITDAEVGLATTFTAPLAWYDETYGESADICNDMHATVVGGDGVTYDVQSIFSNVANDCIVSRNLSPSITVTPGTTFEGGTTLTGTVNLGTIAPAGGATVTLASSVPSVVTVPASVVIPAGSLTTTFSITSVRTATQTPVTLTATFPSATATVNLTVLASPTVASVSLSPTSVVAGNPSTGTVTLTGAAPAGGASVALSSSGPDATVPASVLVAAGATSATFPVTTSVDTVTNVATISASYHGSTQTAPLTITGIAGLASVTLTPTAVDGGGTVSALLTLTNPAPSGGAIVTLSSSNPTVATVPASVTIAAGATSGSFSVATVAVSTPTIVTISGSYPTGVTKSASLTVNPPGNAAFDATLKVPRCTAVASFCDTGSTLIVGRDNMSGGPELNTPNTLGGTCLDGTLGTFHVDESLDRLRIFTVDGTPLAAGKLVQVDATVWSFDSSDFLDLYFAPDATNPLWTLIGTFGTTVNAQEIVISTQFTLPSASLPAIRANWRFTGSAGTCTGGGYDDRDDLVFALASNGVNQPPAVNAGANQTITLPSTASLSGTATDDGLPNPPGKLTTTWSMVSGPGTVTFANASALATTASFSAAGTYVLQLTASDGSLSTSATVQITVNPAPVNQPPVVNAGPDQTITLPATASLNGTASDDGLPNPPGFITLTWSKVSGPGTVTFGSSGAAVTTATFSAAGTYVVQLTANDGALSTSDTAQIVVNPAVVNQPPVVNAGPDQTITLPAGTTLNGTASDDGLPNPPGFITLTWSKVSGPGTVTFGSSGAAVTTATFSAAGTYVVQLTANDGALSTSDTAQITVKAAATNQPPVVNAGPDQTITLPSTASLNGTVTDDGLPNPPGAVTVTWSKVSGPGTVTFASPNAKVTTATFSAAGTYVVQLTASDSALSASDTAQITVNAASSGPCANLCSNPVNFSINGSFQSGNLGTGAVCYQTTSVVHGGNCGNFVSPRTLKVNGVTEPCTGANWSSVPAAHNGGYCIQTTAGNQPWAYMTAW